MDEETQQNMSAELLRKLNSWGRKVFNYESSLTVFWGISINPLHNIEITESTVNCGLFQGEEK
jgi:hypothetical protein